MTGWSKRPDDDDDRQPFDNVHLRIVAAVAAAAAYDDDAVVADIVTYIVVDHLHLQCHLHAYTHPTHHPLWNMNGISSCTTDRP